MSRNLRINHQRLAALLRRPRAAVPPVAWRPVCGAGALAAVVIALMVALVDPITPTWRSSLPAGVVHVFQFLDHFGESGWILIPTGVFLIAMYFIDWSRVPDRRRIIWTRIQVSVAFVFLSVGGSGLTVTLLKRLIGRARPLHFDAYGTLEFNPVLADASFASFPSGHATTIAALATAIAMLKPKLTIPAIAIAVLVGSSRFVIGAHYPADVLAGLLYGFTFSVLTAYWMVAFRLAYSPGSRPWPLVPRPRLSRRRLSRQRPSPRLHTPERPAVDESEKCPHRDVTAS